MKVENASIAILIMVCTLIILVGIGDSDRDMQLNTYCEMVELNKTTGGQYGWPDYRGNAAGVCK